MAYCAPLSRPLRGSRNRRRHRVTPCTDARTGAVPARHADHLGKHFRVGAQHFQRAEVDAQRGQGGKSYDIRTKNLSRLVLRETASAKEIKIDGQDLKVKPGPQIALQKNGETWKVDKSPSQPGLHKTHALQGP